MSSRRIVPVAAAAAAAVGFGGFALAGPGVDECVAQAGGSTDVEPRIGCGTGTDTGTGSPGSTTGARAPGAGSPPAGAACRSASLFRTVSARPSGSRLRLAFTRRAGVDGSPRIDLFRSSQGSRILGNRRVARLTRGATVGRGLGDGLYFARFRLSAGARSDVRRIALRRRDGRFSRRPDFYRRDSCGTLTSFKLERPAFGGRTNRPLGIAYRLSRASRTTVTVTRGGRRVRRFAVTTDRANRTYRLRLRSERLRRGDYRVTLSAKPTGGGATITARLVSARL